jgi:hypothetical protein
MVEIQFVEPLWIGLVSRFINDVLEQYAYELEEAVQLNKCSDYVTALGRNLTDKLATRRAALLATLCLAKGNNEIS